jgi:hypothetical protein
MDNEAVRLPFSETDKRVGGLPYLSLLLTYGKNSIPVRGILDTGNVLPYEVGYMLGANWEQQTTRVKLTGNLASYDARVIILTAIVNKFDPIKLAFAWTEAKNVPLILGQMNFFLEFDICFYAARSIFEIAPKKSFNF